jgi:hypothetical protein
MSAVWVKVDNTMPENDKIVAAGPEAAWLYVCLLCHSSRNLTDGRIHRNTVRRLSDIDDYRGALAKLVEVGLIDVTDTGWVIPDYPDHQSTKDQVEEKREFNRLRQQKSRAERKARSLELEREVAALNEGNRQLSIGAGAELDDDWLSPPKLVAAPAPIEPTDKVTASSLACDLSRHVSDLTSDTFVDDITAGYIQGLEAAEAIAADNHEVKSQDLRKYLLDAVVAKCAVDLFDIDPKQLNRFARATTVAGGLHPWLIKAMTHSASRDLKKDKVQYLITTANNMRSDYAIKQVAS